MIARIKGEVIEILDKGVVISVSGIGYEIYTPAALILGKEADLYTHLVIRDDAHELYGFEHPQEKLLFQSLIGVSGIGPKTALHMFMLYPMSELVRAIRSGDSKAISLVPGIGKKSAEKVIIDLKDKLAAFAITPSEGASDLVEALLSLGFKDSDIRKIISDIDTTMTLEKQITTSLQLLRK